MALIIDSTNKKELKDLAGVFDRLIEDTQRRRDGKFYTPAHLCEAARAYADKYLGEDWRTRGIVWDNSCGTCNLTKGVYFSELYVSTLDQEELDVAELSESIDHRFTTAFQYDFLNDPYEKLPEKLRLAIENGVELTFFCNPPYGDAGAGMASGANKTGQNSTVVNANIDENFKLRDLITQFIYKMSKYRDTKINIILINKTTWQTGPKTRAFRKYVYDKFEFKGGFLCSSKEFSGIDGSWPVAVSIFTTGKTQSDELRYDIRDDEESNSYILIPAPDNDLASYEKVNDNTEDIIEPYPYTSDALTVNTGSNKPRNFSYKGSLGFVTFANNIRSESARICSLWSMPYSSTGTGGSFIYPSNFTRCCEVFTAKHLSSIFSWLTANEQYHIPDFNNPEYPIFSAASLVFSIFHPQAKSTSVELDYKGNHFVIKNHFFWLTKLEFQKQVMDLEPLEGEPDETPYMVTALNDMIKSLEANEHLTDEGVNIVNQGLNIIDQATELLKESYPYREDFAVANNVLQLQHWDAGYKQLKPFWEDLSKTNDEFKVKYDKFKNDFVAFKKMIKPIVWKFGFLKGDPEE